MKDQFQKLLESFNEHNEELEQNESLYHSLKARLTEAKTFKMQIEREKIEIRGKRPALLADGESVENINKRLKEIDEEIELKEDEIIGLKKKIPNLKQKLATMGQNTNTSFSQLVYSRIPEIYPEYNKQAEKLAEIVKEYHIIKSMSQDLYKSGGWTYSYEKFEGALGLIPSLPQDGKAFYEKGETDCSGMADKISEKYNLPDYRYRNYRVYAEHEVL